jgi:hypothetical protein
VTRWIEQTDVTERLMCAECCRHATGVGSQDMLGVPWGYLCYSCGNPRSDHYGHLITNQHKCCPQREPRG